ncbi:uncharacterized protein [Gossypium hirsutum]|uniref:Uncharacterized protein n=1 Tax=Gossypium hirsutum TaxID=3635 RepID=A0ABM2ZHX5_GOSHI|nr:uncharacterized protein LOC121213550 [Gossypium hirsutum]
MPRRKILRGSITRNEPNSTETNNTEQQTAIGSSNVPITSEDPTEVQTENGGTRRGRGRTQLRELYELDPVERVKVGRNSFGQPVGSEARLLAGYMGILARNPNMLSINYESWREMPDSNKNQAFDNIKATPGRNRRLGNLSVTSMQLVLNDRGRLVLLQDENGNFVQGFTRHFSTLMEAHIAESIAISG